MSEINDILKSVPLDDLANQLGVDRSEAEQASTQAIQELLTGMSNNVQAGGEQDLARALLTHADQGAALSERGDISLNEIDVQDGDKIVQHVLGAPSSQAATLFGGRNSSLIGRLLPILAPIVLAYLANRSSQQKTSSGGGLLESILGGGLGSGGQGQRNADYEQGYRDGYQAAQQQFQPQDQRGSYQQAQQQSGGGLGDLLGSILGGGLFGR